MMAPTISLLPLKQSEVDAVIALLRENNLSTQPAIRRIVAMIDKITLEQPVSLALHPVKNRRGMALRTVPAWKVDVATSLRKAQEKWRVSVIGPNLVDPNTLPRDFDEAQLVQSPQQYRIPEFAITNKTRSESLKRFHPELKIRICSAADIFDWLLVRAAVNRQISRFGCCVVCGAWEVKKISGQRSQKKIDFLTKHFKSGARNWPKYILVFPAWPFVCSRSACKNRFTAVFPGPGGKKPRAKFRDENFRGGLVWRS
jgi:hypothetical protein